MTWTPSRRLLTPAEAAVSVHRPASTVRRWIREGKLRPHASQGRHQLYLEADVLEADARTRHRR